MHYIIGYLCTTRTFVNELAYASLCFMYRYMTFDLLVK